MKLATITTLSALLGVLLAYGAVKTAEQLAKSSLSRLEMAQQQLETQP